MHEIGGGLYSMWNKPDTEKQMPHVLWGNWRLEKAGLREMEQIPNKDSGKQP